MKKYFLAVFLVLLMASYAGAQGITQVYGDTTGGSSTPGGASGNIQCNIAGSFGACTYTTLAGYSIGDAYTKAEVSSNFTVANYSYSKAQADASYNSKLVSGTPLPTGVHDASDNYTGCAAGYIPVWNATSKQFDCSGSVSIGISGFTPYSAIYTDISGNLVGCASSPYDASGGATFTTAQLLCPGFTASNVGYDGVADASYQFPVAGPGMSIFFNVVKAAAHKAGFSNTGGASDNYIVDASGNLVGTYKDIWLDNMVFGQSVYGWTQQITNATTYRWFFRYVAITTGRTFTGY